MVEVGHQAQVLLARELAVDRRDLAGEADQAADRVGLAHDVEARDPDLAGVGGDQRREDVDDRRLAGPVRAEQREHRALGDVEVDAVEDDLLAERLAEAADLDRRGRR